MTWRKLFKRLWNLWFPIVYDICPNCKVPLIIEELQNNLDQGESKCVDCVELERIEDERINKKNYEEWQKDQDIYQGITQNMMNQLYGSGLQSMQQQQHPNNELYNQLLAQMIQNSNPYKQ